MMWINLLFFSLGMLSAWVALVFALAVVRSDVRPVAKEAKPE
jgi:hypothetical protein